MKLKQLVVVVICALAVSCAENAKQSNVANVANKETANANQKPVTSQTENSLNPAEAVKVSVEKLDVKAGTSAQATIKLNVVTPFHINANPPSEKNLIATTASIPDPKKGFFVDGTIYPKGEDKKFAFSEKPLSVYEGETVVKIPFKVNNTAEKGENLTQVKVTFQPCTDEVCYRPQTINVELPITVK